MKRKKTGLPPGSVVFTGNQKVEKVQIHHLKYDAVHIEEKILNNHTSIVFNPTEENSVNWYDIRGMHDTQLIEKLGGFFEIHPLVLEDVVDIHQRPKFDEYQKGLFLIIKALTFEEEERNVAREQIAIFFRKGLLISFQEDHSDTLEAVRQRIHSGNGRIRKHGADYLAFALLDAVVDKYFVVLDQIGQHIDSMEDELLDNPTSQLKERIHHLKKEVISIRKSIAPLREAISRFGKTDNSLVQETTVVFIRDLYDHTVQIMDNIDSYRDILNGLQDLYISEISFKMNQVMQVLTIITTIFVPLSFLAGLYGMNFDHIPELHYRYAYFILLGFMATVALSLLYWFKTKNWL